MSAQSSAEEVFEIAYSLAFLPVERMCWPPALD